MPHPTPSSPPFVRAAPRRAPTWAGALACALVALLTTGCGRAPDGAAAHVDDAARRQSALRAVAFRQNLCRSIEASWRRLRQVDAAPLAAADLASVRFLLGHLLNGFPPGSAVDGSRLRPEALQQPQRIAALRDEAAAAATAMTQSPGADPFVQSRQRLARACAACHAQLAVGVPFSAAEAAPVLPSAPSRAPAR